TAVAITALDIVLDNGFEFLCDAVALQGDAAFAVDIDRRRGDFARAGQADADVGVTAFARTIDHATHDRDVHGLDTGIARLPDRHLVAQIALYAVGKLLEHRAAGASAAWAGHHHGGEGAQAHGLQNFLGNDHLAPAISARL